jgi:hypothetical protein
MMFALPVKRGGWKPGMTLMGWSILVVPNVVMEIAHL